MTGAAMAQNDSRTGGTKAGNVNDVVIMVGTATCGRSVGALEVLQAIREEIACLHLGCVTREVGCLGHCYAEPLVLVGNPGQGWNVFGYVDTVAARCIVRDHLFEEAPKSEFFLGTLDDDGLLHSPSLEPRLRHETRMILRNCGLIDPLNIEHYIARDGYNALYDILKMDGEDVIGMVEESGLRGRGGAGFPIGRKWRLCRNAEGSIKYIVCNADEGDPGAFIDRTLLESDPHAVIEGMLIAGYAVGATKGYIYVRAEYPLAVQRLKVALGQARAHGFLGQSVCRSAYSFDIKVFEAAGAFVCGEETALIASLEGQRGIPRLRPPYPAEKGLFGAPTVIDNAKTLAYIRHIITGGPEYFASIGVENNTGTAVFALAGKVARPGLVEVSMGTTLREIIEDVGGGMVDLNFEKPGRARPDVGNGGYFKRPKAPEAVFKAVQIGGPSGGCLPASLLDLPVSFDSLADAGAMMGSGGMVVMAEDDCMVEMARYFLEFTQRESCGACTFCRVGTRCMFDILTAFTHGRGTQGDLERLAELAVNIREGSFCNLGATAPNPVLTTIRYFEDEYRAHFEEKQCPALVCKDLISYEFVDVGCVSACESCSVICDAISSSMCWDGLADRMYRTHEIDDKLCIRCSICVDSCAGINHRAVRKVTPAKKGS